jgi:hypothetical protein
MASLITSNIYPDRIQIDPNLMTSEEVGSSIFEFKKGKYEEARDYFLPCGYVTPCPWTNEEEERARLIDLERNLRNEITYFTTLDAHETVGGLSRTMNDDEISAFVQAKFDQLRNDGILLTRSEFEQCKPPVALRTLGKIYTQEQRSGQLDRLWGAEYLRKHLSPDEPYRVPRFFLIIEDHVKNLPVVISDVGYHLAITHFDVKYGEILAEEIKGTPASDSTHLLPLKNVDYTDVYTPDNILKTEDGLFYIVDTEWLSFRASVREATWTQDADAIKRNYLRDRFRAFHPWTTKEIEVQRR